jgi:prephenate dehydrogenase
MWDRVAIVGVGLIGGSIGMGLRSRGLARTIVGIGRNEQRLQLAKDRGAVSWWTGDLGQGVAEADLIVVCTPVAHIVEHVRQASRDCPAHALITDAGSTKATICRTLAARWEGGGHFVGSHPMAGSEKSGAQSAEPDLFEGCITVVTPTAETREEHVEAVSGFWQSLGARVVRTSPEDHDRAVAAVSHLPHLVASALAAAASPDDLLLAAGGWRDTTRVASADAALWQQIFTDNRASVLQSLDKFEKVLSQWRRALEENQATDLVRLLEAGKRNRDSVGN